MYKINQNKVTKLKTELRTLLLSCIIYTNQEAYEELSQISKMENSTKTAYSFHLLAVYAKSSISDI